MQKRSFFRAAAALLCLCMLGTGLCGCTQFTFEAADSPGAPLPTPDTASLVAPLGDSRERYSIRATLYYRTADGFLSSALRLIHVDPEDDALALIMQSLLETPYSSSGLLPIAPEGTDVNRISLSGGIAVVDLNAKALSQGEEYFCMARAAIAKTLLALESVDCVNVLVEGRAAEAEGVPLGALTQQDANAAMSYIQLLSEPMLLDSDGGYVDRSVVLYLPGQAQSPLAPQHRTLRLHNNDYLSALIDVFAKNAASALYPAELLAQIVAQEEVDSAGRRVLTLRLPAGLAACCAQERLVPALILSLCAFAPNIDLARAYIGDVPVLRAGGVDADADGAFDPNSFTFLAGTTALLYHMTPDGALAEVSSVLQGSSLTARDLLVGLMAGPQDDSSLSGVFPDGTHSEDILGVRIEENIAHVNISPGLYSACQAFSPQRERALVYGIVNTLVHNLDTVQRVQFYIDGHAADSFAGSISIRTPLMANPALVR